jgi:ketosteroid isomerase-like protein
LSGKSQANAQVARSLWRAATQGDPDPVLEFDPHVVWRTWGSGANAGEFRGIDAVLRYLAASSDGVEDMRSELLDVLASERAAVIHYRVMAERGPKRLDGEYFLWLRIVDGVVEEVAAVPFDQAAAAAFWRLD